MTIASAKRSQFDATIREATVAGRKQFEFKISTDRVARDGYKIPASAWSFDAYLRNPVVLLAHSSRDLPIGRAVDVRRDSDGLSATIEFDDQDELARQVQSKVERGFVSATSVGFSVGKIRGDVIEQAELLEVSIVAVPSDPGAMLNGRDAYQRGVQIASEWRSGAADKQAQASQLAALAAVSVNEAARPLLDQLRTLDAKRRMRRLGPAEQQLYNSLVTRLRGMYR